ncbi:MAG: sigma 54-interacting transcriptional regulator [bacterium]|nr:sigma 54-interacting transcriptional regulator [bacterium]
MPESMNLLLRAYDALDMALLVVSHDGLIHHYNQAYAELRSIALDEMVGHPVAKLDRRASIKRFLHAGAQPQGKAPGLDLRRNQETILPIEEEGHLLGCVVLVTPAAQRLQNSEYTRRRALSRGDTAAGWTASYTFDDIIGDSPALQRAHEVAENAAQVNSPVLLLGESGTGKELFAHAIHMSSQRREHPFVPIDCSAISRELLEAELFGYAPGAFTGATKEGKPGKFELANGGTVFLDEIGEMPLEMQAKLLRVLQDRRITRVGGLAPFPVDFRIISATNRNLDSMVNEKRFRHDLLYRMDVIRIEIPALRDRPGDIPLLLEQAWAHKSDELGMHATLAPEALHLLTQYLWPGNIRELWNLVERLLVSVRKPVIEAHDLPLYVKQDMSEENSHEVSTFYLKTAVADAERHTLERALHHTRGNRNMAAELVGLSRASFYRKLKEYGLTHDTRDSEVVQRFL